MSEPAKEVESKDKPKEAPAGSGGGSKLVVILAAVNTVAALGALIFGFMSFQKAKEARVGDVVASAESEPAHGAEEHAAPAGGEHGGGGGEHGGAPAAEARKAVQLDKFIINLHSNSGIATLSLEVSFTKESDLMELDKRKPQMRDIIINAVSAKGSSELATATGKSSLKDEIRIAIDGILTKGKVEGVYFLSFYVNSGGSL